MALIEVGKPAVLKELNDDNGKLKYKNYTQMPFPESEGTSGQVLKTDGSGGIYWGSESGGGSGGDSGTFYVSLTVTMGEGGITITSDESVEDIVEALDQGKFVYAKLPLSTEESVTTAYMYPFVGGMAAYSGSTLAAAEFYFSFVVPSVGDKVDSATLMTLLLVAELDESTQALVTTWAANLDDPTELAIKESSSHNNVLYKASITESNSIYTVHYVKDLDSNDISYIDINNSTKFQDSSPKDLCTVFANVSGNYVYMNLSAITLDSNSNYHYHFTSSYIESSNLVVYNLEGVSTGYAQMGWTFTKKTLS